MQLAKQYRFYGNPKKRPETVRSEAWDKSEPYVADPKLIRAVNLAIYLGRPLLLEGEAGCGKTRLASAVAYELGLPFERWDVRSTSRAREGLYEYDAILRLHDVEAQKVDKKLGRNPSDPKDYRRFGALGKAFNRTDCSTVVLIDEIDKADLDFPNDLLTVLDDPWEFFIPETQETITATYQPIIIITSNKEKGNLPAPFLRRCLYYFVEFPSTSEQLKKIVEAHYQAQSAKPPGNALIKAAADRFLEVRQEGGLFKTPGTSEFLDWLDALWSFETKPYTASTLKKNKEIPYPEVLFKLRADWKKYAPAS